MNEASDPVSSKLRDGVSVSHYRIDSLIGAGGMGEVYRAHDSQLDRPVALKILPADLVQDSDRVRRFVQEAKTASSLNHPHIVTIYEIGRETVGPRQIQYIAMELIEGRTLRVAIHAEKLPLKKLTELLAQAADALAKAHASGIVHRDLKPDNIMVTHDGFVKVLDFGIAKLTEAAFEGSSMTQARTRPAKDHTTHDGVILGTPSYMSPEQAHGKPVDHRTDLFSIGCILYEAATRKKAFEDSSDMATLAKIVHEDPPPAIAVNPKTPQQLSHVIRRCLAKDPDERYQSMKDLAIELRDISHEFDSLSLQSDLTGSASKASRSRGSRVAWTVAAAAIVLSAVLASIAVRRTNSPRPIRFTVGPPSGWTFTIGNNMGPPAVSPDGRYVAFPARDDISGRVQIWVRDLAATQSVALAGTQGASSIFWSPTSASIGFFAGGNLKRVDLSGGDPQTICPASFGRGGTWSQYNEIVFAPSPDSPLYRVNASGGVPQQLTHFDAARGDSTHRWPYFLPDGKHFLFLIRGPSNAELRGDAVYVAGVDSPTPRLLLHASSNVSYTDAGYLLYLRDQTLLAQRFNLRNLQLESTPVAVTNERMQYHPAGFGLFSSSRTGVLAYGSGSRISSLLWVDRQGHTEPVIAAGADYFAPRLSADQRQILYSLPDDRSGNHDLWLFDISRHVSRRVTFHPWDSFAGVLTPDGKQLIFSSNRSGSPKLYIKGIESTEEKLLLGGSAAAFIESMSPDGRTVLFRRPTSSTQNDIYSVPVNGGSATPIVTSPFNDIDPVFSPSGRWIAYASDESGRYEVYVTHYPPNGSRMQISTDGGTQPVWRGDEKELYYVAPGDRITSVAIEQIAGAIKPGASRVIAEIPLRPAHDDEREYDVTRDGQRFLVNSLPRDRRSLPITVVFNWPSDLAQK